VLPVLDHGISMSKKLFTLKYHLLLKLNGVADEF